MEERQERQPLLDSTDQQSTHAGRRQSIVSFHENDSDNPLEWSNKYKWSSVALLCMFAAVVYDLIQGSLAILTDFQTEHIPASASSLWLVIL